jgi:hypothetical protein
VIGEPTADDTKRLPLAIEFFELAKEFLRAFRDLPTHDPPDWPRYFMLCHSVELALKAYLLLQGVSADKLRSKKFGHDLKKLLRRAIKLGLPIESLTADIELLNEAHRNHWPRYPKLDARPVPTIDQFEIYVQEVFIAVCSAIYGSAHP